MYICMLNPMSRPAHRRSVWCPASAATPFFAPIALKALISKEPLEENGAAAGHR